MEELEISLMQIISYSGEARSLCFEALENYREGKKNTGLNLYKDAEENLYTAMVHAEDQMMASEIIYQMTRELFKCLSEMKG